MKSIKTSLLILVMVFTSQTLVATIIYVTLGGNSTMTGSSWATAYPSTDLQMAINSASSGDSIWVACGTYYPTSTTTRSISFNMRNGVEIYGGFTGTETTIEERNLECGPCSILSGDIGIQGNTSDNSYTVVSNSALNNTAVLDGFTIEGGNDNSGLSNGGLGLGGGIYNHAPNGGSCSPTYRNLLIQNNIAVFGGGAFNNGYNGGVSDPIYINCIFYQNHATTAAGGMDSYAVSSGNASPTLYNCIFYENTSNDNIGAMYAWGGNNGNSNPTLYNCIFANNHALNGYAGAFIADAEGGGGSGTSEVTLQNCIIWGNTSTFGPDQFYVDGAGAQVLATYSNIDMSNQTGHVIAGPGTGNLFGDPGILNIDDLAKADTCWFSINDMLSLQINSLNINAGNTTSLYSQDILNEDRIIGAGVDIGAYEYQLSDTVSWIGTIDSSWFVADNWNPARIPDSLQVVSIPSIGKYPIIYDSTAFAKSLIINGTLEILSTGQLQLKD